MNLLYRILGRCRQTRVATFNLGESDILVITSERDVGLEEAERIRDHVQAVINKSGRQSLVLHKDFDIRIVRR